MGWKTKKKKGKRKGPISWEKLYRGGSLICLRKRPWRKLKKLGKKENHPFPGEKKNLTIKGGERSLSRRGKIPPQEKASGVVPSGGHSGQPSGEKSSRRGGLFRKEKQTVEIAGESFLEIHFSL